MQTSRGFEYVTDVTGSVVRETLDVQSYDNFRATLALGPEDNVYIVYHHDGWKLRSSASGTWKTTVLPVAQPCFPYYVYGPITPGLAVDSLGHVLVALSASDGTGMDLNGVCVLSDQSGTMQQAFIDTYGRSQLYVAFDRANLPHILFTFGSAFDYSNYTYHMTWDGHWTVTATGLAVNSSAAAVLLVGDTLHLIIDSGESFAAYTGGPIVDAQLDLGSTLPPFGDLFLSSFYADILWLYDSGITSGCSDERFCPDDPVTRGQMAAFLDRALHLPSTATDYFTDDDGTTFEGNINRLAASGITKGCSPTLFCPTDHVTRGQMAAFLDRAFGLPVTATDSFTDDDGTTFEGNINRLAASGITKGCGPTTYCPTAEVTRGQMAAFLHRVLGS